MSGALNLPVYSINFSNSKDKKMHDELVELVEIIIQENKNLQLKKGSEKEQLMHRINKINIEIN